MRPLFYKGTLSGLILAALAAGTMIVPAVAAQGSSTLPSSLPHKKATTKPTRTTTSSTAKKPATSAKSTSPKTGKSSSHKRTRKVKGQSAPTSARINEIQDALARDGVLTGTPTGKWDDSTMEAMKKFQASNGLNPSGKLDALTLQKLGLGSQTAGLAAPTPPPNSVNRLRNTNSVPEDPRE